VNATFCLCRVKLEEVQIQVLAQVLVLFFTERRLYVVLLSRFSYKGTSTGMLFIIGCCSYLSLLSLLLESTSSVPLCSSTVLYKY
jgi:hypothetical protein